MPSIPVPPTADIPLLLPVADVALPTTALATVKPLASNVHSAVTPTTGNICTTPGHHLDLCPEGDITNQGRYTDSSLTVQDEETNTIKVRTPVTVVTICQKHNSCSKTYAKGNLPSKHSNHSKEFVVQKASEIHWKTPLKCWRSTLTPAKLDTQSHNRPLYEVSREEPSRSPWGKSLIVHNRRMFHKYHTTNGLPKPSILQSANHILLVSYTDGVLPVHTFLNGHIGKLMPIWFFIVNTTNATIICHVTNTQLGLLKVLCLNRATHCRHLDAIKNTTCYQIMHPQQQQFTLWKTITHLITLYKTNPLVYPTARP